MLVLDREYLAALEVTRLDKGFIKRVIDAGQEDPEWSCVKTALEKGKSVNDDYTLEDGMVCYRRCIWIPDDNSLRLLVANTSHDTKIIGYFIKYRTLNLIR